MYVCYIDESGTPDIPGNTSHFVLAGFAIPISQWKTIDDAVSKLLTQYGLGDAEFHTAWILRKYLEQSRIPNFDALSRAARRAAVEQERTKELLRLQKNGSRNYKTVKKAYAHTRAYIHLSFDERKALVAAVADLIASWDQAKLFAECINKIHFNPAASPRSLGEQAFEQVISRFERFLLNKDKLARKGTSKITLLHHGLIVHDNNETVARKHTALMRQFHANGTLWTNIERIIDTPLFVNSSLTSMVQIADLCAYALRRYFENGEAELFNRVFTRADKIKQVVVGVRHFSEKTCSCSVCVAHRVPIKPAVKFARKPFPK